MANEVSCDKCGRGPVVPGKARRMPGVVVVLGFLLIIGSVVGFLIGGAAKFGGKVVAEAGKQTPGEIRQSLQEAKVPDPIIAKTMRDVDETVSADELKTLDPKQVLAVQKATLALVSKDVDPALLDRSSTVILAGSAIALVLGWILRMKKDALRCTSCGATKNIP